MTSTPIRKNNKEQENVVIKRKIALLKQSIFNVQNVKKISTLELQIFESSLGISSMDTEEEILEFANDIKIFMKEYKWKNVLSNLEEINETTKKETTNETEKIFGKTEETEPCMFSDLVDNKNTIKIKIKNKNEIEIVDEIPLLKPVRVQKKIKRKRRTKNIKSRKIYKFQKFEKLTINVHNDVVDDVVDDDEIFFEFEGVKYRPYDVVRFHKIIQIIEDNKYKLEKFQFGTKEELGQSKLTKKEIKHCKQDIEYYTNKLKNV